MNLPAIFATFAIFLVFAVEIYGSSLDGMVELQKRLTKEKNRITREATETKRKLKNLRKKIDNLEVNLKRIKSDRKKLTLELEGLKTYFFENRERIKKRLNAIYRQRDMANFETLFLISDPVFFFDQLSYSMKIVEQDRLFFKEISEKIKLTSQKKGELEKKDREEKKILEKLKAEKIALSKEEKRLSTLLSDLHNAGRALEMKIEEFKRTEGEIDKKAKRLYAETKKIEKIKKDTKKIKKNRKRILNEKVDFYWPVRVKKPIVMSFFGKQKDSALGIEFFNAGVDIKTDVGEEIVSAIDGVVKYRGRMKGMGFVVMVESKEGRYITLYAMLKEILVGMGEHVKAGDVIGIAGPSPW